MGGASRDKGQRGERELAELLRELTGCDVRRRVRQHGADSDLEGLPGWSIECKRHRATLPGDLARWWQQAAEQARTAGERPLLAWRADRMRDWVFVWPAALHCTDAGACPAGIEDTLSAAPLTWWRMVRLLDVDPWWRMVRPGPPSGPLGARNRAGSSALDIAPVSGETFK